MKKVLSYVIWSATEKTCVTRLTDSQRVIRYWYNIPYLLIANTCLFPDFSMDFCVPDDSTGHPFFAFLGQASKQFSNINLRIVDKHYKGTQLTIERMRPLWDENVEYLFCKDVDYAVSGFERRGMDHFMEQNECFIQSIRAFKCHNLLPFYAGLCGFKCKEVCEITKSYGSSFKDYLKFGQKYVSEFRRGEWGCDQILLKEYFSQEKNFQRIILDCPQTTASLKVETNLLFPKADDYTPVLCTSSEYEDRPLTGYNNEVLTLLDQLYGSPSCWNAFPVFLGRGWSCSCTDLIKLLRLVNNEMSEMVKKVFIDTFGKIDYETIGSYGRQR